MSPRTKIFWTCNDVTKSANEWAEEVGIDYHTLYHRIEKARRPVDEALGFVPREHPHPGQYSASTLAERKLQRELAQSSLNEDGRNEAGQLLWMLLAELKRRKISWNRFSEQMGWPSYTLSRWKSLGPATSETPWVDEMEACWNRLGFTLVPDSQLLKLGSVRKRLKLGVHPVVCILFTIAENRGITRKMLGDAADIHRNTVVNMAVGKSRGKVPVVEACYGVLGMPLRPVPLQDAGADAVGGDQHRTGTSSRTGIA